jgi:hypothetical protein
MKSRWLEGDEDGWREWMNMIGREWDEDGWSKIRMG